MASRPFHRWRFPFMAASALIGPMALAADAPAHTAADTLWVALSAALVFFMQAGFALLEGGMARSKNAVNVLMKNYMDACVGGLIFWLIGFGLMFGYNPSGWLGTSHFAPDRRRTGTGPFCSSR